MGYVDWAHFGLPPAVETGKDGFPRPGKAVRWYREQKKHVNANWTQKRLAQELGLTERAICYLESHDVGLDSISLRRRLADLFTVPPMVFGLTSLQDETDPGQTVKQHRKMKLKNHPLSSQKGLARALSITDKAVRDMEKRNIGLDSIARRRVLALLLDIPPSALGLITLEEMLLQQKAAATIPRAVLNTEKDAIFDLAFYKDRLKTLWNRNHISTAQDRMAHIAADMAGLTTALPYVSGEHEKEGTGCPLLLSPTLCSPLARPGTI